MRCQPANSQEAKTNRPIPRFGFHDIMDKRERESEQKNKPKPMQSAEIKKKY